MEETTLVCALADAPCVVKGSIFDRRCGTCQRAVMVAPSGQRVLRSRPATQILCMECFCAVTEGHDVMIVASEEEVRNEMRNVEPNYRRHRN
jgi:hypothetical protein